VQKNHVHNLVEVNHGHDGTSNESQGGGHAGSTADGNLRNTSTSLASTASLGGGSNRSGGVLGGDGDVSGNDGLSSGGLLDGLGDESGGLLGGLGSSGGLGSGLGSGGDGGSVVRTLVGELLAVVNLTSGVGDLEVVGVRGELRRSKGERVTLSRGGQGLVVLEVGGLSVLENDGAARLATGEGDGVRLALGEVELGVGESRLGQGHGGEGSGGSDSVLHFEGWKVVCD